MVMVGLNQKYARLGIMSEMINVFRKHHPVGKKAKCLWGEITNDRSRRAFEGAGFEVKWEIEYKKFADFEHTKIYANAQEVMKKKGYDIAEKSYYMSYVNE